MSKARVVTGLVGGLLLWAVATPAWAAPTVAQILQFKPRQAHVGYSTPAQDEHKNCEVKLISGSRSGSSGWMLFDAKKQPLRRFFDVNGDKKIDIWSYYKDGVEVYREIDSNNDDRPDQFRWLNSGGMKWGTDANGDSKIDFWKQIAAEEVAEEVFQAIAQNDFNRLQALLITEPELRALKLPEAQASRVRELLKQAPERFGKIVAKLPSLGQAQFVRVESAAPSCLPADTLQIEHDLLTYPSRSILYETADKKHDWLQTGEMMQVGLAWRLLDLPNDREPENFANSGKKPQPTTGLPNDPEVQKLLEALGKLDASPPAVPPGPGNHPEYARYNIQRVELLEKIVAKVEPEKREIWIKQIFDNLNNAVTNGDQTAMARLVSFKDQVVKGMPTSNLAAYATFRWLWATYSPKIAEARGPAAQKIQEEWLGKLAEFVQAYPKAEDTPDALIHLAMGCEFAGKEEEAKRWYGQLATHFPENFNADKARGAVRRLEMVGKEMELKGPQLSAGAPFDLVQLRGKVIAVYYWASYCSTCVGDFARLKQLHGQYSAKGFELVCVNLDDKADEAQRYLQTTPVPGMHLFQPPREGGGLNSPLATHYGIMGLPSLVLVGKDGKAISRTIQINDLEEAIKKGL